MSRTCINQIIEINFDADTYIWEGCRRDVGEREFRAAHKNIHYTGLDYVTAGQYHCVRALTRCH